MTTALKPTVHDVGINDLIGKETNFSDQHWYQCWCSMIKRCYSPISHKTHQTYIGCIVDPRWYYLSNFKQWYDEQGDVTGKQLDKDIISPGNKVYGPDTCLFVSPQLNTFFTRSDKIRGKYPLGVYKNTAIKRRKPYHVQIRDTTGKKKFIGYYATPEEAHQAFIQGKKELLLERFILPETDQRLKQALYNVYNNMEEYFK
jgi:hypothetical protein